MRKVSENTTEMSNTEQFLRRWLVGIRFRVKTRKYSAENMEHDM
jgi:hypothetical protein